MATKKVPTQNIEKPTAFKHWINQSVVESYVKGLSTSGVKFDQAKFLSLSQKLGALELRDRVKLIAQGFKDHLPQDYSQALRSLMHAVESQKIEGFALWPVTEFIQLYGINDFESSFAAMSKLTIKFTAEFAVRPFIKANPTQAFKRLNTYAQSDEVHLRRWASEGSRPRLPWGERLGELIKDPNPSLEILERLKFDPELYVRKSVSNHLNDIAKDHPKKVIDTLTRWKKQVSPGFETEFNFILNRSLRTLIKKGNPQALALIGITHGHAGLVGSHLNLNQERVKLGTVLEFSFTLKNTSKKAAKYVIDYAVWHQKANGTLTPKVFKFKTGTLKPGQSLSLSKRHSFKPITTRVYYPGLHQIEILVNGVGSVKKKFMLHI